jgi:hypothetical protein
MQAGPFTHFPRFDDLVAYERGELTFDETVNLFQSVIDTGLVAQLQPFYQRTAQALVASGHCVATRETRSIVED